MDESAGVATEPVRVGRINDAMRRADDAYTQLRMELGGTVCSDVHGAKALGVQVALRVGQMDRDVQLALLTAMLLERMCGVTEAAAVIIPQGILDDLMAGRQ